MAAYKGNIGIMEMIEVQSKANTEQLKRLDRVVQNEDVKEFKRLVKEVTGTELH